MSIRVGEMSDERERIPEGRRSLDVTGRQLAASQEFGIG